MKYGQGSLFKTQEKNNTEKCDDGTDLSSNLFLEVELNIDHLAVRVTLFFMVMQPYRIYVKTF